MKVVPTARILRTIVGRTERDPRVAGNGRLSPARVGQPDQPGELDDLAAAASKLLMGLSFHGASHFVQRLHGFY